MPTNRPRRIKTGACTKTDSTAINGRKCTFWVWQHCSTSLRMKAARLLSNLAPSSEVPLEYHWSTSGGESILACVWLARALPSDISIKGDPALLSGPIVSWMRPADLQGRCSGASDSRLSTFGTLLGNLSSCCCESSLLRSYAGCGEVQASVPQPRSYIEGCNDLVYSRHPRQPMLPAANVRCMGMEHWPELQYIKSAEPGFVMVLYSIVLLSSSHKSLSFLVCVIRLLSIPLNHLIRKDDGISNRLPSKGRRSTDQNGASGPRVRGFTLCPVSSFVPRAPNSH